MTTPSSIQPLSHQLLSQAADWFALLRSGNASAQDRSDWQQWLGQHPDHRRCWQFVEAVGHRFESISKTSPAQQAEQTLQKVRTHRLTRRKLLSVMAVSIGTGALGWSGWKHSPLPNLLMAWQARYQTATGEIREVILPDSTRVWMNSASAFNTDFHDNRRSINLVRGEILIETGKNNHHPLIIHTTYGQLQPLGTRFTVRENDHKILLSVFEGAVEIRPDQGLSKIIHAGEQIHFNSNTYGDTHKTEAAREAWTRGMLLADDIRLQDLIEEVSRYRRGYISVSPEIADLRVFGGYPLNAPDQLLSLLEEALPIKVEQPLPWWVSIEKADP